jgi:hypothetical protein
MKQTLLYMLPALAMGPTAANGTEIVQGQTVVYPLDFVPNGLFGGPGVPFAVFFGADDPLGADDVITVRELNHIGNEPTSSEFGAANPFSESLAWVPGPPPFAIAITADQGSFDVTGLRVEYFDQNFKGFTAVVPEPSSLLILAAGLGLLAFRRNSCFCSPAVSLASV